MCAFIFERSSAPCDAELRFGATRGRCRRSQGAQASRRANCDVVKTQARSGCRRVFQLGTFAVAASELAAFDSDDACLLGTLSLNLAESSAQNLSQKQLHQTKKQQNGKNEGKNKNCTNKKLHYKKHLKMVRKKSHTRKRGCTRQQPDEVQTSPSLPFAPIYSCSFDFKIYLYPLVSGTLCLHVLLLHELC